ncbi:MAG: DUF2436 domain-containing protein, partial [Eubacteriaceae bacterium]|nr:DUF2436 domain-containing protein [Eubacteriaceae bacterium]
MKRFCAVKALRILVCAVFILSLCAVPVRGALAEGGFTLSGLPAENATITVNGEERTPDAQGRLTGLKEGDLVKVVPAGGFAITEFCRITGDPVVTLSVQENIWGPEDTSGYQLLLDADAEMYSKMSHNSYSTVPFDTEIGSFKNFEYLIPENAKYGLDSGDIVRSGSVSVTVPSGVYDLCILNLQPGIAIWYPPFRGIDPPCMDDIFLEDGRTYTFRIYGENGHDGVEKSVRLTGGTESVIGSGPDGSGAYSFTMPADNVSLLCGIEAVVPKVTVGGITLSSVAMYFDCATGKATDEADSLGDSYAAFDPDDCTLILHNYYGGAIEGDGSDLIISCVGANVIGTQSDPVRYGISGHGGDLTINGSGSLDIHAMPDTGLLTAGIDTYDSDRNTYGDVFFYTGVNVFGYPYRSVRCAAAFVGDGAALDMEGVFWCGNYSQDVGSTAVIDCGQFTALDTDSFEMTGGELTLHGKIGIQAGIAFCMSGGTLDISAAEYGIRLYKNVPAETSFVLEGGELTVMRDASVTPLFTPCGIYLYRTGEAVITGGKIMIPDCGFTYGIYGESSTVTISGGAHEISGSGGAVVLEGGSASFTGGTTHMYSRDGAAIVTAKGIFLEGNAAFADEALRVIGVADPTASTVPAGSEAMWSVYDRDLDPDIGVSSAEDLAARDVTVTEKTVPVTDPGPATGLPGRM